MIGVQVSAAEAATYASRLDGYADCTDLLMVRWGIIQPGGAGAYDWSTVDADVAAYVAAGLEPLPHVQCWINAGSGEYPHYPAVPANYTTFITALVNRYKANVHQWAIENEVIGGGTHWSGTTSEYGDLLDLVEPVIHAEDATAKVIESGHTSGSLKVNRGYVYFLAAEYGLSYLMLSSAKVWDYLDIEPTLNPAEQAALYATPAIAALLGMHTELLAHAASFDGVQAHWYGNGEYLNTTLSWYAAEFATKTLGVWEIGTVLPVATTLPSTLFCTVVAQQLLASVANASDVVYYPYVSKAAANPARWHMGLLEADGTPREAETVFRRVVRTTAGTTGSEASLGALVVALLFEDAPDAYGLLAAGDRIAVWSKSGTQVVDVSGTFTDYEIAVLNMVTGAITYSAPASVSVSTVPVMLGVVLPTVDGVHVPAPFAEPSAYVMSDVTPGSLLSMADGSIRRHAGAALTRLDIHWKGITAAEVALLLAWYKSQSTTQLWEDVEGGAWTVRPIPRTWKKTSILTAGGFLYDVQFSVQGVEA